MSLIRALIENAPAMLNHLPWMGLVTGGNKSTPRGMIARVVEQSLPGTIVGVAVAISGVMVNDARQNERIEAQGLAILAIAADVKENREDIKQLRRDIYNGNNAPRRDDREYPPKHALTDRRR